MQAPTRPQKTAHYPSKDVLERAGCGKLLLHRYNRTPAFRRRVVLRCLPMPRTSTAAPVSANSPAIALWPACLDALAQEVSAALFDNWLRPLEALPDADPDCLRLQVASSFKCERVRKQFDELRKRLGI